MILSLPERTLWANTVPHISEMPSGWLQEDLDSGLGSDELSPDSKLTFHHHFYDYLLTFDQFINRRVSLVGTNMDINLTVLQHR